MDNACLPRAEGRGRRAGVAPVPYGDSPARPARWVRAMTRPIPGRIGILAGIVLALGVMVGLIALPRGETADVSVDAAGNATDTDLGALIATFDRGADTPLSGPWALSLPRDFGAHENARSETWSITAHLRDPADHPIAITVILSRLGAADADDRQTTPFGPGPVHIGQVIVTSTEDGLRGADDRVSRMAGTAGHDPDRREVWVDDWVLAYGDDNLELDLRVGDQPLRLSLAQQKQPLRPDGMATGPTRGFSISSLAVTGTLGADGRQVALSGSAWLDRLWGDVPLPGGPLVRDRMVLHLSDGTDLSLLQTRRRDGRGIATIDGILVATDGSAVPVDDASLEMTPVFAQEGDAIATSWRIRGAALDIEARILDVSRQEGFGTSATVGLLSVEGTHDGQTVAGTGTVLLSSDGLS